MAYPKIKHNRILNHDILGEVKVYEIKRLPRSSGHGCQSDFFLNGAKENNPNQFALKMFKTSIEAFAAYQRQQLAAKNGYAPPVGKMVLWIMQTNGQRTRNRWGYETAVADTSTHARQKAMILGSLKIHNEYTSYCKSMGYRAFSKSSVMCFWDYIDENWDAPYEYSSGSALDDVDDPFSLRFKLKEIDIGFTQYDDCSEPYDNCKEKWNDNLRLGVTWNDVPCVEQDSPYMFTDLHSGNIGLWNGKPVVIDFGYHIACPAYRNFDRMENTNA